MKKYSFFLAFSLGLSSLSAAQQTNTNNGYTVYGKFQSPKWATSILNITFNEVYMTWENEKYRVTKHFGATLAFSKLLKKPDTHTVRGLTLLRRVNKKTGLVTYEFYTKVGKQFATVEASMKRGWSFGEYRFKQYGKSWRVNLETLPFPSMHTQKHGGIRTNALQPADTYTGTWSYNVVPKY